MEDCRFLHSRCRGAIPWHCCRSTRVEPPGPPLSTTDWASARAPPSLRRAQRTKPRVRKTVPSPAIRRSFRIPDGLYPRASSHGFAILLILPSYLGKPTGVARSTTWPFSPRSGGPSLSGAPRAGLKWAAQGRPNSRIHLLRYFRLGQWRTSYSAARRTPQHRELLQYRNALRTCICHHDPHNAPRLTRGGGRA